MDMNEMFGEITDPAETKTDDGIVIDDIPNEFDEEEEGKSEPTVPTEATDEVKDAEDGDEQEKGEAEPEPESEPEPELKKSSLKPTELKAKAKKAKPESETMEETMLRLLLTEQNPELLEDALAKGKTIRGAWNYVVSVMRNAYIAKNGRTNGGMVGSPAVVLGIAEKYLREYEEGTVEPEVTHTPKKPAPVSKSAPSPAKVVEKVAKKAAKKAKKANESGEDLFSFFNA